MKKIFINAGLFLLMALVITSCNWIDEEINVDPDSPSDVPMEFILPAIQANLGYVVQGNDNVRTTNLWMQFYDGEDRQSFTETRYQLTAADVNNMWNTTYYRVLMNCQVIIEKANVEGAESPHFNGVAKVLTAVTLGITSDLYGDIPHSDAYKGAEGNSTPLYDSQQDIYTTIQTLLSEAITELGAADVDNAYALSGDLMLGDDPDAWMRAAYALKARYAMQLSKVNGNSAATEALGYMANAMTGNGGDLQMYFSNDQKSPMYQFMDQRGDVFMCSTFLNMLNATADPRTGFYATDEGDGYVGSDPGSQGFEQGAISRPGNYVAAVGSNTFFMTYAEQKFIEAEANVMLGNAGPALTAWQEAVSASVLKVTGSVNQTWLDANINGVATVTMQDVMEQKYLAMYGQTQAFADWRRTGWPNLSISAGATLNAIPRRFPYAQDEIDYNVNTPSGILISQSVWWDQ